MNQAQSTAASAGAAPETLPVVRQQLDSLATQQFNWQGQIWPGQEMRWQIAEEPARQNGRSGGGSADEAPEWRSHMRLSLPQLGEIDARIALRGDGVRLDIATGDETTQARLRDAMADLRSQFDNAGLTLAGFAVAAIDGKAGALDASAAEATDGGEKP
jgi:flagellar hook-length control protein FliK